MILILGKRPSALLGIMMQRKGKYNLSLISRILTHPIQEVKSYGAVEKKTDEKQI